MIKLTKKIFIIFSCLLLMIALSLPVLASEESNSYLTSFNGQEVILSANLNKAYSVGELKSSGSAFQFEQNGSIVYYNFNITGKRAEITYYPFGGSNYSGNYIKFKEYNNNLTAVFTQTCNISVEAGSIERFQLCYKFELANGTVINRTSDVEYNNGVVNSEIEVEIPQNCEKIYPYFFIRVRGDSNASNSSCNVTLNVSKFNLKFIDERRNEMPVTNVISPIVEGATGLLSGIGSGTVSFFESIFLTSEGQISALGTFGLVGTGIGIAIGVIAWIKRKI